MINIATDETLLPMTRIPLAHLRGRNVIEVFGHITKSIHFKLLKQMGYNVYIEAENGHHTMYAVHRLYFSDTYARLMPEKTLVILLRWHGKRTFVTKSSAICMLCAAAEEDLENLRLRHQSSTCKTPPSRPT